jgi:hypothetical protein
MWYALTQSMQRHALMGSLSKVKRGKECTVEEQQLCKLVHRLYHDESFRQACFNDLESVAASERMAPLVLDVLKKLIPHLALGTSLGPPMWWWHP